MIITPPWEETVLRLLRIAQTRLPPDIGWALESAAAWERNDIARVQLGAILDNVSKAEFLERPICQDTGLPIFFVKGKIPDNIEEAIAAGVRRATEEIPLRPNAVDPLSRENSGDNVGSGPLVHYHPADTDYTEISVLPKGAGAENMSKLAMLLPSDGEKAIKEFVIRTVLRSGGRPCPPTVVGVGIGGSADKCLLMAKEALLTPLDRENPDPRLRAMEEDLFTTLNSSGLGPMGLGGDSTVLGVRIMAASCHTASLPVAVSLNCWAARRASVRVYEDGRTVYSQGVLE
ncbi:MAG: fumarate hydratase subunit alpha [Candidatus Methanomethylophilaceae archaeon]|nr:fumarate hydratase subunit alpha [Candidatus Methanomethylophilaceae archaeon]MDI3541286.1 fumarate hydratase subunit alpha [Candidatus Methanomethylophilaceae archaeon]